MLIDRERTSATTALVLSAAFLALETATILILLELPGIPYNVRQLFQGGFLPLRVLVFSALTVWVRLAPAATGRLISKVELSAKSLL